MGINMKIYSMKDYIRNITNTPTGTINCFLGAGASIQSQVPSAYDLVWQFKRTLYCNLNNISEQSFKDLQSIETKRKIQSFFYGIVGFPKEDSIDEYSFYFEKCFPSVLSRRDFIESKVSNKLPSSGYLCLAALMQKKVINNIFTTNFDSLVESAIHILEPLKRVVTLSSSLTPELPVGESNYKIVKFHGDYLYDKIQNTSSELKSIEEELKQSSFSLLNDSQMFVVGYAGNDDSVINWLYEGLDNNQFLSKGLFWCVLKGQNINEKTKNILEYANKKGREVAIIEITDFDDFLYNIYSALEINNEYIDNLGINRSYNSVIEFSSRERVLPFIKFNSFELQNDLEKNTIICAKTSINSFDQLRAIIGGKPIIATLRKGNIYYICEPDVEDQILPYLTGEKRVVEFQLQLLDRDNSIEYQLIYDLIFYRLTQNLSIQRVSKRKIIFNEGHVESVNKKYIYYEAVNISLNYYSKKLYLILEPTLDVKRVDGVIMSKFERQENINYVLSKRHNTEVADRLLFWQKTIIKLCNFDFSMKNFKICFNSLAVSNGGILRQSTWPMVKAFEFSEPQMQSCYGAHVNQLIGLIEDGPFDCIYGAKREPIRLAVLAHRKSYDRVIMHLKSLLNVNTDRGDGFLKPYDGFEKIYRQTISIPNDTSPLNLRYDDEFNKIKTAQDYYKILISKITTLIDKRDLFDIVIIHIPEEAKNLRLNGIFNLHDAVKIFCANKLIKVQFIEDKSISHPMQLKVKWGLSSGLYAKANGELWQPKYFNDDTAFIGISYSLLPNGQFYVGCSQLFDSCGNGMRLIINQLRDPKIIRKNPYMSKEDAAYIVGNLLRAYYQSSPISKIKRVVVHKTTEFIPSEIEGINLALSGIENVELIQLQEFTGWRGIQFNRDYDSGPSAFSVKRGTTVQLSENTLLLWTHGCVKDPELNGRLNYYKGGRGIPAPILVKRFQGRSSGEMLVNELLMLTKMNWNSGDSLYKNLPVTIDFSKIVARMSKQKVVQQNKTYDFRYFM